MCVAKYRGRENANGKVRLSEKRRFSPADTSKLKRDHFLIIFWVIGVFVRVSVLSESEN